MNHFLETCSIKDNETRRFSLNHKCVWGWVKAGGGSTGSFLTPLLTHSTYLSSCLKRKSTPPPLKKKRKKKALSELRLEKWTYRQMSLDHCNTEGKLKIGRVWMEFCSLWFLSGFLELLFWRDIRDNDVLTKWKWHWIILRSNDILMTSWLLLLIDCSDQVLKVWVDKVASDWSDQQFVSVLLSWFMMLMPGQIFADVLHWFPRLCVWGLNVWFSGLDLT